MRLSSKGQHTSFKCSQCSKWKISRNGTLVKILEHSEEQFMFSSYNQSRRNGTLIHLHLTNRNGVPVRSVPFRALGVVIVILNLRFLQRLQKRSRRNQFIHRHLTRTQSIGRG